MVGEAESKSYSYAQVVDTGAYSGDAESAETKPYG